MNNIEHNQDVTKDADGQSRLTDVLADKAKVYAWCESLDKGVIVCRKTGHLGDSETIAEVVKWMRDMSANSEVSGRPHLDTIKDK